VKREEAKQGLSLHDARMNGLASRGVNRMGDADCVSTVRIDAGDDIIRRRWNNLDSMKDSPISRDDSHHDLMIPTSSVRFRLV
jgi:hypothetical protein